MTRNLAERGEAETAPNEDPSDEQVGEFVRKSRRRGNAEVDYPINRCVVGCAGAFADCNGPRSRWTASAGRLHSRGSSGDAESARARSEAGPLGRLGGTELLHNRPHSRSDAGGTGAFRGVSSLPGF